MRTYRMSNVIPKSSRTSCSSDTMYGLSVRSWVCASMIRSQEISTKSSLRMFPNATHLMCLSSDWRSHARSPSGNMLIHGRWSFLLGLMRFVRAVKTLRNSSKRIIDGRPLLVRRLKRLGPSISLIRLWDEYSILLLIFQNTLRIY